jgi:hypothetical protein
MVITVTTLEDTYEGNNSTTVYAITLPFLSSAHVKATLDDVVTTDFTVTPGSLVDGHYNGGSLEFDTAPGSGVSIKIYCDTPVSQDYIDADAINSLDISDVEQALDHMTLVTRDTRRQQDNSATEAAASATAAATSATNAATSETNAGTSATNAATSATNAATSATNAASSSSNASTSATNAATSETNAAASAAQAATTASNLSGTLSGNYILPSEPSLDVNDRFTVTEQMKAFMTANAIAFIPTSGLTETWHAWLFNGTGSSPWSGCQIESTTYTLQADNGTSLGTGVVDIDHGDQPLFLYYDANANKVIVCKMGGGV